MSWVIEFHPEVIDWIQTLGRKDYRSVLAAIEALKTSGPALGRPFVDHIKGSKHKNMKELRPPGKGLRLLFAFDTERKALLLVAESKLNDWTDWYNKNIPVADLRFDAHLKKIEEAKNDR